MCGGRTGTRMKHAATRDVFAYWDRCRGERAAPDRADIEPGEIRHSLGDTFVLSFDHDAGHPFRIAGSRICAMFGRELKSDHFLSLWGDRSILAIDELLAVIAEETVGMVGTADGRNADGQSIDLELLLLPLGRNGRVPSRLIGTLSAPQPAPYWIGIKPLTGLELAGFRHLGPAVETVAPPHFSAPAPGARERSGFVVYDGGRDR